MKNFLVDYFTLAQGGQVELGEVILGIVISPAWMVMYLFIKFLNWLNS